MPSHMKVTACKQDGSKSIWIQLPALAPVPVLVMLVLVIIANIVFLIMHLTHMFTTVIMP